MKINFELEIGAETAFVSFALEETIKTMKSAALTLPTSLGDKEQYQMFANTGKRLSQRFEEIIKAAIPFDYPKA